MSAIDAVDRLLLVLSDDDTVAVRAASGDVRRVLAVLDALPRCEVCGTLATVETDGAQRDPYRCDAHHEHYQVHWGACCTDLPHADAVRALAVQP